MAAWNYRAFGTIEDPIHKSDLASITGDYGCLRAFKFNKDLVAEGKRRDSETECNGRMTAGTATHEAIARALGNDKVQPLLLAGDGKWCVTADQCMRVWHQEFDQSVAGRLVHWYDQDETKIPALHGAMIAGVLNDMANHVLSVRSQEAGFIVRIGDYWCSGHTDLIYEPRRYPGSLALADFKTGAQRPHQIELDHSWESGIYSAAMRSGIWIDRARFELPIGSVNKYMREREALEAELIRVAKLFEHGELPNHAYVLGQFPADIRYVHLADYPPYLKATTKEISRPEELEFFGYAEAGSRKFAAGDRRGPAWYRVRRTETDIPRLESLLKNVIGTVRMGRFFENVGEKCSRCSHREPCLNSGYEVRGDERAQLERVMAGIKIDDDGIGEVA